MTYPESFWHGSQINLNTRLPNSLSTRRRCANPSSWAKLQARVNWGLNLAHLRDCRVLCSTLCLSMRKSWVRGRNEAEGAGTRGSSVTIVGETQSDIKSYQPFTSYPPPSHFCSYPHPGKQERSIWDGAVKILNMSTSENKSTRVLCSSCKSHSNCLSFASLFQVQFKSWRYRIHACFSYNRTWVVLVIGTEDYNMRLNPIRHHSGSNTLLYPIFRNKLVTHKTQYWH